MKKTLVLVTGTLLLCSAVYSQKIEDFLGAWEGPLTLKWGNPAQQATWKLSFAFTSVKGKTLKGSALIFDRADENKIMQQNDAFEASYDAKDNSFSYRGYANSPDGIQCLGKYVYRLSADGKSITGAFTPQKKDCIEGSSVLAHASQPNATIAQSVATTQGGNSVPLAGSDTKAGTSGKKLKADRLYPFQEGLAIIKFGTADAVIDRTGNTVIPFNKYLMADFGLSSLEPDHGFINGACVAMKKENGLIGLIDPSGKPIVPFEYILAYPFDNEGWARVTDTKKNEFFINRAGIKMPVPTAFYAHRTNVLDHSGGISDLFNGGPTRDIALSGRYYIARFYRGVSPGLSQNGMAYFNRAGKQVIAEKFEYAAEFSEGLACVAKKDDFGQTKYGFIDLTGKMVIEYKFTKQPGNFNSGLAYVEPANRNEFDFAFIRKNGEVVLKQKNWVSILKNETPHFEDGYFRMQYPGRSGVDRFRIIDSTGADMTVLSILRDRMTAYAGDSRSNSLYPFRNGMLIFSGNSKNGLGILNLKTNRVTNTYMSEIVGFDPVSGYSLGNDLRTGRQVFIDLAGNTVLEMGAGGSEW